MERACVLLKDVLDHSLEEAAGIVGSTVGGVKAALNRGRAKLAASPQPTTRKRAMSADLTRILGLYVERFTQHDWDGLRELIAAGARLRVADRFAGRLGGSPYFGNDDRLELSWRMVVGEVDGEPALIGLSLDAGAWVKKWMVRVSVEDHRISRIADYMHCPWLMPAATSVIVVRSGAD